MNRRIIDLQTREQYHSCRVVSDPARGTYVGSVITENASEIAVHGRVLFQFGQNGMPAITSPAMLRRVLDAYVDFDKTEISTERRGDPRKIGFYLGNVNASHT